ncbi:hypothetical protein SAMN05216376_12710 [Mameliella alba]|uniref:hypothetical protein n=1 Tax=Mameliella alba TaxID=561184 RepID=UPI00088DCB57|nr:hypothetical protein [Mameliella alba]OWV40502.1 hypothetical protein CDZ96_25870 [Mameliella alba]PTR33232.1 hypothetical protein LX94_05098 [Mameliella alba]GGF85776.1 hypothetical protein GCM10011319_52010 [Mameliella alba]SDE32627.1 hypothetical protein SAMN05216376_12710 [Mameliella alba]
MKYFDVFAESGFHSAFLTTYAFGAQAFEDVPFSRLRGSGCRNIVILADRQMVNQSFAELGPPKFAGSSYHLVKADAPGAFHPKITLLVGAKKGRLLIGSANLTALGLGGNRELVASLSYDEDATGNAYHFAAALNYIRSKVPSDDLWFATAMQRALRSSPWLRDVMETSFPEKEAEHEVALLHDRPDETILDQIAASVGDDRIERLIVVSPYWDMKLEGLARLRAIMGEPPTDLLIDAASTYFPKTELPRFSDIGLFKVDTSDSKRFVHAKLVIAQGQAGDHVISGSMNCTLPALLGPTIVRGNAEAGIYKRVPPGTALAALGLENYRDAPLPPTDLQDLASAIAKSPTGQEYTDGGTMILQSGRLVWKPPAGFVLGSATAITLQDREEVQFGNRIDLVQGGDTAWRLDLEAGRPKFGIIHFSDGFASAPVQVIDLDVLAVRTLPPAQGRKKSLTDILAEAMNEDLILIETLNQLEALELEETGATADPAPKAFSPPSTASTEQVHAILPYDEFVRARSSAMAQGSQISGGFFGRHDSPANTLSAALNRIIGLVGLDLDADEDRELKAIAAMDFRMTEPATPSDAAPFPPQEEPTKPARATKQAVATAKKMKEAVDAFEARCRLMRGKPISTAELVRLRALLQILLSHAQPIRGAALPTQILPIHTKDSYDWPRLVGRLLKQHFGTARALQTLQVAQDEGEQKRVLEYLAMADWAAKAAATAAASHPKTADLRGPLESLAKALAAQVALIIGAIDEDRRYFDEFTVRLDERFADRLALNPGVRLPCV